MIPAPHTHSAVISHGRLLERMKLMEVGMTPAGAAAQGAEARATATTPSCGMLSDRCSSWGSRRTLRGLPRPPPTSLIDTRTLEKPNSFDGHDAHWHGYRLGISAYAAAADTHLGALMTSAATVQESDTLRVSLNLENQTLATQL